VYAHDHRHRVSPVYAIALIPGDGIGREVVPAAAEVLAATGVPLRFVELDAGWETFQRVGTALPEITVKTLRACDAALFGAVSSPSHRVPGYRSPIVEMRRRFGLYANLRPAQSVPIGGRDEATPRPYIDILIVRENTEGLYAGRERVEDNGNTAIAERVITRRASARIARAALEHARRRRGHLTIVHKANILRESDGLFRETVLAEARAYPEVRVDEGLVDSVGYRLVRNPDTFDVIVAPNLYGDLLSDLAAALVGGLGVVPSGNVGDNFAVFEPVHGSAPDIAGRGIANPVATIRAAAMLLAYLGERLAAQVVDSAVDAVLRDGPWTPDLGGTATTAEVTGAIIERLEVVNRTKENGR